MKVAHHLPSVRSAGINPSVTESEIQRSEKDVLTTHPKVAWFYVTTTGSVRRRGSYITLGYPGISDILGQLTNGLLLAVEVKKPGKKPTEVQYEFMLDVVLNGGVAFWVDDPRQVNTFIDEGLR